jgi:hypothetical protein
LGDAAIVEVSQNPVARPRIEVGQSRDGILLDI